MTVVYIGTPSVVEVPAAETTAILSGVIAHTTAEPKLITIEMSAQAATTSNDEGTVDSAQAVSVTSLIDGTEYSSGGAAEFTTFPFTTTFTFQSTTLELSYTARETFFTFEGAASTEVTIPSQHTHVTVNGVETAVALPGLTTTIEVSESTVVLIELPEVTTELAFTAESYVFSVTADTIDAETSSMCGTFTLSENGETGSTCLPGITTTITLPSAATASELYLYATGLTTSFALPGITTTFAIIEIVLGGMGK